MRTVTTSNERGESLASSHHCHLFLQSFGFLIIFEKSKSHQSTTTPLLKKSTTQNNTETMTRSSTFLLLLLAPLSASAFTVLPSLRNPSTTAVFMSEAVETGTNLVLTGNNIELTPALQEYAQKRIGGLLEKLGGGIVRECEVHLSVSKNPKVRYCTRSQTLRS